MIWIAVTVDLIAYALLAALVVRVFRNRLPEPFNQMAFTVPLVVGLGAILSLATMPHWRVW
jgi:hypothetical protein